MNTLIPAKDVEKVIFQELQEFAKEQYPEDGEELLAKFLQVMVDNSVVV